MHIQYQVLLSYVKPIQALFERKLRRNNLSSRSLSKMHVVDHCSARVLRLDDGLPQKHIIRGRALSDVVEMLPRVKPRLGEHRL